VITSKIYIVFSLLLLLVLVLIMEALLPDENLLEAVVQGSPFDCVESVFTVILFVFLGCKFFGNFFRLNI